MKEALFILLVLLVLIGLTAIRYRKQIAAAISFARMLQEAKSMGSPQVEAPARKPGRSNALVLCPVCGVRIPTDRVKKINGRQLCFACANAGVKQ